MGFYLLGSDGDMYEVLQYANINQSGVVNVSNEGLYKPGR